MTESETAESKMAIYKMAESKMAEYNLLFREIVDTILFGGKEISKQTNFALLSFSLSTSYAFDPSGKLQKLKF